MNKKVLETYKFSLLISITLFVVITALRVEKELLNILIIFLGSILGGFLLETDYLIRAYFVDPLSDFSRNVKTFVKHRDTKGLVMYIQSHKHEIKDKTLNSAMFQIALLVTTVFACGAGAPLLVKTILLSALANSLYKLAEEYYAKRISDWFWSFKNVPTEANLRLYFLVLTVGFVYCLYLL